jgi:hypothetical protein
LDRNASPLALPSSTVNWIGGSGDWNDASHWLDAATMTNHVPTATDDAAISVAGVTVTHSTGADAVKSLSASGGTFTLSGGTLIVTTTVSGDDAFMLSGGTPPTACMDSFGPARGCQRRHQLGTANHDP